MNHISSNATASIVVLLSLALSPLARPASAVSGSDDASSERLEEVVVTAQRRTQSIIDIPYNISVVGGDALSKSGALNVNDLAQLVPGLSTVDTGPGTRGNVNNFVLRGLRTDSPAGNFNGADVGNQTVSSVATYFGETPLFFPLVMKDIERVEVLRGPQGTLYGSGSEAGTIRFIPKRPTFDSISGEVNVSSGMTKNSPQANGSFDGVLNLPLASTLAVRIVAGFEHLGGFIDDVNLAQRDSAGVPIPVDSANPLSAFKIGAIERGVNTSNQSFERIALRWKPGDAVDIEFGYLHQNTRVNDIQASNPAWPGGPQSQLEGANPLPDAYYGTRPGSRYGNTALIQQPYGNNISLGTLVATLDLATATLTSASSYFDNKTSSIDDASGAFINFGGPNLWTYFGNDPRSIAVTPASNTDKSFVEEIRLVSKWNKPIDYTVGLFYQHEIGQNAFANIVPGLDAFSAAQGTPSANPQIPDTVGVYQLGSLFTDRAVFGELTWHISPKWQLTGGARLFWQDFSVHSVTGSPYLGTANVPTNPLGESVSDASSVEHNHIFKLNSSYDLRDDLKLYATFSEGFRRGGANGILVTGPFASETQYLTYKPDFARNYEFGIKGESFEHRLRFSADVYLINLTNFQFDSLNLAATVPVVYNGNRAQTKGTELEATAQLTRRLSVTAGYAYTEARVSQSTQIYDLPTGALLTTPPGNALLNVNLPNGTRLPGVPEHDFTLGIDYGIDTYAFMSGSRVTVHADGNYRSRSNGFIDPTSHFFWVIPDSFVMNSRVTFDSGGAWSVDAFVRNATNAAAYSGANGVQTMPNSFANRYLAQPRTWGLGLQYRF